MIVCSILQYGLIALQNSDYGHLTQIMPIPTKFAGIGIIWVKLWNLPSFVTHLFFGFSFRQITATGKQIL